MYNLSSLLLCINSFVQLHWQKRLSRAKQINASKSLSSFIFKIQNHLLCLHLVLCSVSYLFAVAVCIQLSAISMSSRSLGKHFLVLAH